MAGTTTADFLEWERESQEAFFQISLGMLGTVATQVNPEMTGCIDEWYFSSEETQELRATEMLDVMEQYVEFDPTAFVLAYAESICGSLKR